ncbi:MAG TPA: hypothetical protein VN178_03630 [Rubrobacter sp.]|nr:hypothetical protein [Rubrobacter sp.]
MSSMDLPENVYEVPQGRPEPADDGACHHLAGMRIASLSLTSTAEDPVVRRLSERTAG